MAKNLVFDVKGVHDAVSKLHSYQIAKTAEVKTLVNETAIKVQRGARRRCPVDTGRLRASIALEPSSGGLTIDVGTKVQYAAYVEFGTGSKVEIPPGTESMAAKFKGKQPANPGQKAQPFLFPSLEHERPEYLAKLKEILG